MKTPKLIRNLGLVGLLTAGTLSQSGCVPFVASVAGAYVGTVLANDDSNNRETNSNSSSQPDNVIKDGNNYNPAPGYKWVNPSDQKDLRVMKKTEQLDLDLLERQQAQEELQAKIAKLEYEISKRLAPKIITYVLPYDAYDEKTKSLASQRIETLVFNEGDTMIVGAQNFTPNSWLRLKLSDGNNIIENEEKMAKPQSSDIKSWTYWIFKLPQQNDLIKNYALNLEQDGQTLADKAVYITVRDKN